MRDFENNSCQSNATGKGQHCRTTQLTSHFMALPPGACACAEMVHAPGPAWKMVEENVCFPSNMSSPRDGPNLKFFFHLMLNNMESVALVKHCWEVSTGGRLRADGEKDVFCI